MNIKSKTIYRIENPEDKDGMSRKRLNRIGY